jgi:hypothetical protein
MEADAELNHQRAVWLLSRALDQDGALLSRLFGHLWAADAVIGDSAVMMGAARRSLLARLKVELQQSWSPGIGWGPDDAIVDLGIQDQVDPGAPAALLPLAERRCYGILRFAPSTTCTFSAALCHNVNVGSANVGAVVVGNADGDGDGYVSVVSDSVANSSPTASQAKPSHNQKSTLPSMEQSYKHLARAVAAPIAATGKLFDASTWLLRYHTMHALFGMSGLPTVTSEAGPKGGDPSLQAVAQALTHLRRSRIHGFRRAARHVHLAALLQLVQDQRKHSP